MEMYREAGSCPADAQGGDGTFIVLDVETPNRFNDRISAIGIAVVRAGRIREEFYSPVDPEEPFDYFNTMLTGLDEDAVRGAPTFAELWPRISPHMERGVLAAHNAVFDLGVIRRCLKAYGIKWKETAPYVCTVQMGRRLLPGMSHKLNVLCDHYGIALDHHQAMSDSRACAKILLRYIRDGADVDRFVREYRFGDP